MNALQIILIPEEIEASMKIAGLWDIYEWTDPAHPSEIFDALRKQDLRYKEASKADLTEAFIQGQLKTIQPSHPLRVWNKITNGLIRDTFGARLLNTHTGTEDQVVRKIAIGTDYTLPSSSQAQLVRETLRETPLSQTASGDQFIFVLFVDFAEANGVQTTVAAGTLTTTQFTVASAAGFAIGDAIRIQKVSGYHFTSITNIVGNLITIDATEPLPVDPLVGQTVLLCLGEGAIFGNTTAGAGINTGKMFARSRLRYDKTNSKAILVKATIIATAA